MNTEGADPQQVPKKLPLETISMRGPTPVEPTQERVLTRPLDVFAMRGSDDLVGVPLWHAVN